MLMGANDGGVNEQLLKICITGEGAGHAFPNTGIPPTREADVGAMPVAEFGRQVAPRYAGTHDPENRLDEKTIVFRGATRIAGFTRQQMFNATPLIISQQLSKHPDLLERSGCKHISLIVNRP